MQTFTIKLAGSKMTAKELKEYIWQCSQLSKEEISVVED